VTKLDTRARTSYNCYVVRASFFFGGGGVLAAKVDRSFCSSCRITTLSAECKYNWRSECEAERCVIFPNDRKFRGWIYCGDIV
jgi:hypothetical protein